MKKPDISRTQGVSHKTLIFFDTILLWYNYAKFHHCEIYKIDNGINNDINDLKMVLNSIRKNVNDNKNNNRKNREKFLIRTM